MTNKSKRILPQILTLVLVVLIFGFFTINAQMNMSNRGIDFGYGFDNANPNLNEPNGWETHFVIGQNF